MIQRSVCLGLLLLLTSTAVFAQRVTAYDCATLGGSNCTVRIPDAPQGGVSSSLTITAPPAACTTQTSVNVHLAITHSWIGDLQATVTSPNGTATLISNLPGAGAGGCQGADIDADFGGIGAAPTCGTMIPAVSGNVTSVTPTSVLLPTNASPLGVWTLNLADTANGHDGALTDWSVDVVCATPPQQIPATSALVNGGIAGLLALIALVTLRRRRII